MSKSSGLFARLFSTPGPTVAVEVAPAHVTAVAVTWAKGAPQVLSHSRVGLPPGAVVPNASAVNIHDRGVVTAALREVLRTLPRRTTRVALAVPDTSSKVSFVHFDTVPGRTTDLERLIAWQVRRSAPFRVEDAQLAYALGAARADGGQEFVVALIRRDIVEEYEGVCKAAGVHAGLLDLTSFNVINAVIAMSPVVRADWLLVYLATGYSTLAIVRGQDLIFFRNRPTQGTEDLVDLVHQTAMYYQDRLDGRGLARAVLVQNAEDGQTGGATVETVQGMLEDRLNASVERLGSSRTTAILGVDPAALDLLAGPVGLLIRDHAPAA